MAQPKPMSASVLDMIVHAELRRRPVGARRRSCTAPLLKCVMLAVHRYEGQPLSLSQLAEIVGCCDSNAYRAIKTLVADGVLRRERDTTKPAAGRRGGLLAAQYRLDLVRLRELQPRPAADLLIDREAAA